jgi:heme-degrading monooxygenase HmoA
MIATTPTPPYYAVIFTSIRNDDDGIDYGNTAQRMVELGSQQPGFLGIESAREDIGITVSYWQSEEAILNWRQESEHTMARETGRSTWYKAFKTRVCKVERDYGWEK